MNLNLADIRKQLHKFPEISGEEKDTAQKIESILGRLGIQDLETGIGGHGILAFPQGRENTQIMVRCELDALPIPERNTFDHRSTIPGKMHACGHDGHMSILLGLAEKLMQEPIEGLSPVLLFQPAEETGKGALEVIKSDAFQNLNLKSALALHNIPGQDLASISARPGTMCMISVGLKFRFLGSTSHAAFPELGNSPNKLVHKLFDWVYEKCPETVIATPVHTEIGSPDFGINPGLGTWSITLRSASESDLNQSVQDLIELAVNEGGKLGVKVEHEKADPFPLTGNHADLFETLKAVCTEEGFPLETLDQPFRWSEDFGHFKSVCPSLLFGLGSGVNQPNLHYPNYDFPDEIQERGSMVFYKTLEKLSKKHGA